MQDDAQRYLDEKALVVKKDKAKETTWYAYRNNVSKWQKIRIAKIPIQRLKALDLERVISSINGKAFTKKQ